MIDMVEYRFWLLRQVCYKCGARQADRTRDASGKVTSSQWRTEVDCGCPDVPGLPEVEARSLWLADGHKPIW
jgi:hypothetical protein